MSATGNDESVELDFIRESNHQRDFDGRWMVFHGSTWVGVVRKGFDALKAKEPWGYESQPTVKYEHGVSCEGGYRTRKDAALALFKRIEECGGLRFVAPRCGNPSCRCMAREGKPLDR